MASKILMLRVGRKRRLRPHCARSARLAAPRNRRNAARARRKGFESRRDRPYIVVENFNRELR
jgi:hypothetical protein